MYSVKEIFYTLQGEGAQTGRAAVFCRFAGCNLWTGREADRAAAVCRFCDTDFVGTNGVGGGKFASAESLAEAVAACWASRKATAKATAGPSTAPLALGASGFAQDDRSFRKFVVCTGGEPLLQLDAALIEALHRRDFEIAVETNGTCVAPEGLDWVCVSPKAGAELRQKSGDELKLVFPQLGAEPELFEGLEFRNFFLQPMDGPNRERNTALAARYCMEHPQWRVSLQTHKLLGIP
jgi:7-carboxy-7-deazaguanine synthase (Cx14CxxC type)